MKTIAGSRVLVTGASGFLGSYLVEKLVREGCRVSALLRKNSNRKYLNEIKGVSLAYGNLLDMPSLKKASEGMEVAIHCAALMSNYDWRSRSEFYRVNCTGAENMLQAAMASGVKHFVHISTVGVLGGNNSNRYLDEAAPYGERLSKYEWSKCEAERILSGYIKNYNYPITIVRLAQLYGPRMVYGWLATLKSIKEAKFAIIGNGASLIHMTYIDDVVDGIISLILKEEAFGETFNFAGPEAVSLKEVFCIMAKYLDAPLPKSVPYAPAYCISAVVEAIPRFMKSEKLSLLTRHRVRFFRENHVYSIDKAREKLGYNPKTGLDSGIQRMVDWFRQNGYLKN